MRQPTVDVTRILFVQKWEKNRQPISPAQILKIFSKFNFESAKVRLFFESPPKKRKNRVAQGTKPANRTNR